MFDMFGSGEWIKIDKLRDGFVEEFAIESVEVKTGKVANSQNAAEQEITVSACKSKINLICPLNK